MYNSKTGYLVCLEQGADLHMAQLMPLPLTVSCFSKIQIGFTFLVPAHPGGKGLLNARPHVCVCMDTRKQADDCFVMHPRSLGGGTIQMTQLVLQLQNMYSMWSAYIDMDITRIQLTSLTSSGFTD